MNWLRKLWIGNKPEKVSDPTPDPVVPGAPPVEPVAFISDIHGNLQALRAVLADIEAQGVREIICLGDIVGYGGNPAECVQIIRAAGIPCVRGNHDAYAGGTTPLPDRGPDRNPDFTRVCHWTRAQVGEEDCRWLGNLPFTLAGDDFEAVHTSLHRPERWPYLLIAAAAELHFVHQRKPVCFVGHTHQPKMWVEGMEQPVADGGIESLRAGKKQVANVGSVGQPRDENPNACYLILRRKERDVWWRRVPYDIEGAQRAITDAGLLARSAKRLAVGK
jgi:predicted phosphodiesterase